MLARVELELALDSDEKLWHQKAVILQGVLMEQIDAGYASILHESRLHSYSQFFDNKRKVWVIQTFDKEAYEKIIIPIMDAKFQKFRIEHDNRNVSIVKKSIQTMSKNEFMQKFYFEDSNRYIRISFGTPTAFKSGGRYINYPDISLIYKSLVNKYDSASERESLADEELLEELINATQIVRYDLHSCSYHIGSSKIPAFMGKILLRIDSTQAIVNFSNMLFRFGQYSGVGIKTAMGMGNIEMSEVEK